MDATGKAHCGERACEPEIKGDSCFCAHHPAQLSPSDVSELSVLIANGDTRCVSITRLPA